MTIAEAIAKAAQRLGDHMIANARLDAEVLLGHVLGRDRAWLLAHAPDQLEPAAAGRYEQELDRRAVREPLQYITGRQEFWGLRFAVSPDVLIPRPETELVVETALRAAAGDPAPVIIDLCTGSGCIAVSLACELPGAQIAATDRSPEALAVARANARTHGVEGRIRFYEGDLFSPLAGVGGASVITSNPPYIRTDELPALQPEVRDFEPEIALVAGPRGTEVAERIIARAPEFLRPGGTLVMEMGLGQAAALRELCEATGEFDSIELLKDLAGIDRVIVAAKK